MAFGAPRPHGGAGRRDLMFWSSGMTADYATGRAGSQTDRVVTISPRSARSYRAFAMRCVEGCAPILVDDAPWAGGWPNDTRREDVCASPPGLLCSSGPTRGSHPLTSP